MHRSNQKKARGNERAPRAKRHVIPLLLAASCAALLVLFAVFTSEQKQGADAKPPAAGSGNDPAVTALPFRPDFRKLEGQWQRPDGGYVIAITKIEANGKMQAGYYNPKPIHVARAESLLEGETMTVFIELNDVNYPGSTYTLRHDPANDQLHGVYYQALLQQSFEVTFVRMK